MASPPPIVEGGDGAWGSAVWKEAFASAHFAAARIQPKKTGSYYLIVEVEKSPAERTTWSLAYGFR